VKKFFSILICGVEQVRRKQYARGCILYAVYLSAAGFLTVSLIRKTYLSDPVVPALLFLIVSFVWLYNLLDIVDLARQGAAGGDAEQQRSDDLYEKGRVLYFKGDLAKARECFEELLKTSADDADSVYQLAKIHHDLGNRKEALRLFKRYIKDGDKLEWLEEAKEAVAEKK